jgi:calcineurin-like phosphoesterase family protein
VNLTESFLEGIIMSEVYFTSDEHYWHTNSIPYCRRPWGNFDRFNGISRDDMDEDMLEDYKKELESAVLEMNEALIDNLNAVVKPGDRVYHLGDFAMGNIEKKKKILNRLKGQHFLVKGNHDDKTTCKLPWAAVYEAKGIRVEGQYIWMSHYPHASWNRSYHGSYSFFGHVHSQGNWWCHGLSCDVGVDYWQYKPVLFDELKLHFQNIKDQVEDNRHFMWRGKTSFNR